jgi:hypothetical protein
VKPPAVDLRALVEALEADPELAARFARAIAPHVFAVAAARASATYSTRPGCAPPGYSRDAWRALAHRIGVRRGRYHFVDAATLEAHERGEREPKPQTAAPASNWTPADAARAVGLRAVEGGSR